jgi:hypothetical protein
VQRAEVVVLARAVALETGEEAQYAELEVGSALRGEVGKRIRVRSALTDAGRRLPDECYFAVGEKALLLLERSGGELRCLPGSAQARIPLEEGEQAEAEAVSLMRAYLEADARGGGGGRLKEQLAQAVEIRNPQLQSGVLFDLGRLLSERDLGLLAGLYLDPAHSEPVRAWAIAALAGLGVDPPAGLDALLAPSEPLSVRQAVVQVYAAGPRAAHLEVFERALADPRPELRRLVVENLSFPEAVPLLGSQWTKESDPDVRLAIVRNLGLIGTAPALEILEAIAAETRDPAIREAAELGVAAAREPETP